jgi:threonine synthase
LINDYLEGAAWEARSSIQTLASAMDVGNPSNMERLRDAGGESAALSRQVRSVSVSDEQITEQIRQNFQEFGLVTCPHTATATHVWRHLHEHERDWILVATAHPAKFENIVEPIIGEAVELPSELAAILSRPQRFEEIEPTMSNLEKALSERFGL